jgi:hypothetical protein
VRSGWKGGAALAALRRARTPPHPHWPEVAFAKKLIENIIKR